MRYIRARESPPLLFRAPALERNRLPENARAELGETCVPTGSVTLIIARDIIDMVVVLDRGRRSRVFAAVNRATFPQSS